MWRRTAIIVLACLLLGLTPMLVARAAEGTNPGDSPANPIDLSGTITSTLVPGGFAWFRYWNPGDFLEHGITMDFAPATTDNDLAVVFLVWVYENTGNGPQLNQIGMGTPSELGLGVKYWRGSTEVPRNFYIQAVNNSNGPVDYAIAWTAQTFPPPWLGINPDRALTPVGGVVTPSPTPLLAIWTPTPLPAPTATGGGANAQTAAPLESATPATGMLGLASSTWYKFSSPGGRDYAVRLTFDPVTEKNIDDVTFKVWSIVGLPSGPTLTQIGQGTRSGNPFGPKYWRGGSDAPRVYYVEVINYNKEQTVNYQLTLDTRNPLPPPASP